MNIKGKLLTVSLLLASACSMAQGIALRDIHIRDPYILADEKTQTYYMYASQSVKNDKGQTVGGVKVYASSDLKTWTDEGQVFTCPDDNWITGKVWAPEVHKYKGKYYLFATLNSDIKWKGDREGWAPYTYRGTQIFWSKSQRGPFKPFSRFPHTPIDEMALDGTLWVEEGKPYLVYCHEWVETEDGTIEFRPLKKDLSEATGPSTRLFCASIAPSKSNSTKKNNVTDGCFLYRTKDNKLLMTWSNFDGGKYQVSIAESVTGLLAGPWRQQPNVLFEQDGGHSMLFRTFDGRLCIVFHSPNHGGEERAKIYEVEDTGSTLRIKAPVE